MSQIALSGDDTLQISGRNFTAFCDGDYAAFTFPNDTVALKTGKNSNTIYAQDFRGNNADCILRLIRGSADDKFLNSLLSSQQTAFSSFPLIDGQFVKRVGNGKTITNDTYKLQGGVINKRVEAKSNAEGDTEQSLAIWHIKFANADRAIM